MTVRLRHTQSAAKFESPMNPPSGTSTSYLKRFFELAEAILELTGSRSPLVHEPLPQDDPRQRQPDITAAKGHLGWEPKVPLRDGLRPTIAYFDTLLSRL